MSYSSGIIILQRVVFICLCFVFCVYLLCLFVVFVREELNTFMENKGAPTPGIETLTTGLSKPFSRLDKYPSMLKELERHTEVTTQICNISMLNSVCVCVCVCVCAIILSIFSILDMCFT